MEINYKEKTINCETLRRNLYKEMFVGRKLVLPTFVGKFNFLKKIDSFETKEQRQVIWQKSEKFPAITERSNPI